MAFVKLQTSIVSDPKVMLLTPEAFRTYILGIAMAGEHLTDGHVSRDAYALIRGEHADELVERGLWEPAPIGGGWMIANYLGHQTSRAQVEETRKRAAARARKSRQAHK